MATPVPPATAAGKPAVITMPKRFSGCLLGGAVGSSLGYPVASMAHSEILATHGRNGVTTYQQAFGGTGKLTSGSQIRMFMTEGLIRWSIMRHRGHDISVAQAVDSSCLRWLVTQKQRSKITPDQGGLLMKTPLLQSSRNPAVTTMQSLSDKTVLGAISTNDSRSFGSLTKIAPVGLLGGLLWTAEETFNEAAQIAELTHGHSSSVLAAAIMATVLYDLMQGLDLKQAIREEKLRVSLYPDSDNISAVLRKTLKLAETDKPYHICLSELMMDDSVEGALGAGLYCAMKAKNFQDGMRMAINHSGQSDTVGCLTGHILGLKYGVGGIPIELLRGLELGTVIQETALDLYASLAGALRQEETAAKLEEKYPLIVNGYTKA